MLSAGENQVLTETGAGTPMGRLLRRFWLPAALSAELVADGDPKRVELLGERLVAFRDSRGQVGVLDEGCPHRGASLALGINGECGLRCLYHGWKVAVDGRILETPSEPASSTFTERIRHVAYPTREAGGLVWAYLGPPDSAAALPAFEWLGLGPSAIAFQKAVQACNWVQAVEGVIDSAHISYLHSDTYGAPEGVSMPGRDASSGFAARTGDGHPRLEVETMPYGFAYAAIRRPREQADLVRHVRISHFVAPFYGVFPGNDVYGESYGNMQAFVPMNDLETMQYYIVYNRDGDLDEAVRSATSEVDGLMGLDDAFRRRARRENWWLQDREAMRRGVTASGLGDVTSEDMAIQESMGAIVDRSREHLGTSDVAVIRMRRLLLQAALDADASPIDVQGGGGEGLRGIRSVDLLAPADEPWQASARDDSAIAYLRDG